MRGRLRLCPEIELLLDCARVQMDPERSGRIRSHLRTSLNWYDLCRWAAQHGLRSLLFWHIEAIAPEAIPRPYRQALHTHFQANTQHNLFLTAQALELVQLLATHGILAILYKGPGLAASVYGNLALREFYDLDVLIQGKDLVRTREILAQEGYRPANRLSLRQEATHLASFSDRGFRSDRGKTFLEVHWRIVPRTFACSLESRNQWGRLERINLGGTHVLTLAPERLLLALCVLHGTKHCWERLGWICDVAELIGAVPAGRWPDVWTLARKSGSLRLLRLGLCLARDVLGQALPEQALEEIRSDPIVPLLASQVYCRLFQVQRTSPGLVESWLFRLRARECWRSRVECCLRLALTLNENDWEMAALPHFLRFLYYPLRALRMFRRYGCKLDLRPQLLRSARAA